MPTGQSECQKAVPPPTRTRAILLIAISAVFLLYLSPPVLDSDMFHEMLLCRTALERGSIPRQDVFAYTPTLNPVVHHEWGTGVVLYLVCRAGGEAGLLLLRYLLAAATLAIVLCLARRMGGSWHCIAILSPLTLQLIAIGFGTVRAQDFTMLFAAVLLLLLEQDRRGRRWWIIPWLALYLIWLNLHGGFVAGVGIFFAYGMEIWIRRRRFPVHLLPVLAAMALLVLVNPWGLDYPRYLWRAVLLSRSEIGEWGPIWNTGVAITGLYAVLVALCAYAVWRSRFEQLRGLVIVVICAYLALRHIRHAALFGLVCACYLPAWISAAPLGELIELNATKYARPVFWGSVVLSTIYLLGVTRYTPWRIVIPANAADRQKYVAVMYPVGAVEYLRGTAFHGNVMTPFEVGAFVSWKCYPAVKVSLDGRYEVAYSPELFGEIEDFYAAKPGWTQTLLRYPTDVVLAPRHGKLSDALRTMSAWRLTYQDDLFELWSRPDLVMPPRDRRGQTLATSFP